MGVDVAEKFGDLGVANPGDGRSPNMPPGVVMPEGAAVVTAVCAIAFSSSAFLLFFVAGFR